MSHEVTFQVPERVLGKSDIQFRVKVDGEVFGELRVSKGAIVWYRKGSTSGRRMPWGDLDEVMKKYRGSEKRQKPQ